MSILLNCLVCGNEFTRKPSAAKTAKFCSKSCHAKGSIAGRNKNRITKRCLKCGAAFDVNQARDKTALYCSMKCKNVLEGIARKGKFRDTLGICTYRRVRKSACERCGASEKLCVHHKDENRYNNIESNLETLCRRCHAIHHKCGQRLPKGPRGPWKLFPRDCKACGITFKPRRGKQQYCSQLCWIKFHNANL